jgi:hypothetical protein
MHDGLHNNVSSSLEDDMLFCLGVPRLLPRSLPITLCVTFAVFGQIPTN